MDASREDIQAAHRRLGADPSFQQDLPVEKPLPDSPDSGWFYQLMQVIADVFVALAPLLKILLVTAAIGVAGYIIFSIARALYDRREQMKALVTQRRGDKDISQVDVRPDEAFARNLLQEADNLAAQGHFDRAIRLLLHSSIQDMQERIHQKIGISLTAREIGQMGQMPDTSRSALHQIIHTVEINVFAGEAVAKPDYDRARADYETFAFAREPA